MHPREVLMRVHLRDHLEIRGEKNHLHGVFPMGSELLRQRIAGLGPLLHLIDDDGGVDKTLVQPVDDVAVGEQTCSQVGAARSAALVLERAPGDDGEDRPIPPPRLGHDLIERRPVDLEELEEHLRQAAVGLSRG